MLRNEHYKDDVAYVTHLTRYVLTILGVWPIYNRRSSTGEKIFKYLSIFISYMFLFCVLFPGVFFWMIEKRIRVKIQTIPLLLFGFMACAKYGNLAFRQKQISRCLKHVEEDYRAITSGEAREAMIEFANVGRRLILLCSFFMYGNGVSYRLILPYARGKIVTAQNITIRPLPCPAYFIFFDIQESPIYELVFAAQVLSGAVTYMASAGICGLATIFAMHACGQLKIMENMLRSLVEEQGQEKQQVDRKLAEIVEHQIRIRR